MTVPHATGNLLLLLLRLLLTVVEERRFRIIGGHGCCNYRGAVQFLTEHVDGVGVKTHDYGNAGPEFVMLRQELGESGRRRFVAGFDFNDQLRIVPDCLGGAQNIHEQGWSRRARQGQGQQLFEGQVLHFLGGQRFVLVQGQS